MKSEFQIGDRVITTGYAYYEKNVPMGSKGTIIKLRHRYSGSSAEYYQYKVKFDDPRYDTSESNLDNLYTDNHIDIE
jgi:hypothetical protein